jgi:hypothetical protein
MGQLRTCVLAGNSIDRLPPNVDALTSLETLDLRDNQLALLPDALGALGPSLQRLLLGRNRLAALPASLGGLTRLTHLHANCNQLEALPEELGGCVALVELQLSSNRLAQLPGTFSRLTRLCACALQDNRLLLVPAVVGHMGQLTRLALAGNPWLRSAGPRCPALALVAALGRNPGPGAGPARPVPAGMPCAAAAAQCSGGPRAERGRRRPQPEVLAWPASCPPPPSAARLAVGMPVWARFQRLPRFRKAQVLSRPT